MFREGRKLGKRLSFILSLPLKVIEKSQPSPMQSPPIEEEETVLVFDKSYVIPDPQLTKGTKVTIQYDLERFKQLALATGDMDTWVIGVHYCFNNNFDEIGYKLIAYTPSPGSQMQVFQPKIHLDQSGLLSLWFVCISELGVEYDSNFVLSLILGS